MTQAPAADMKSLAKHEFETWADSYDRSLLNHFMFRPSYAAFMEEIGGWYEVHRRPFRVLDIGCGTGTLAEWLAGSSWPVRVVGMDYAEAMCREASAKAGRNGQGRRTDPARFATGDSEHLPFDAGSFDIVTCSNSFHHYPDQQAVVNDMRRVLKPDGRLILIDGFRDNIIGWVTFDVIVGRVESNVYHAPWSAIHNYFRSAGFSSIRQRKLNLWFPLLVTVGDAAQ
ncbi:MAG: class I SAM-dependent methyltransferase [bacterium]|nr:class I SAM-dependent methyltransferase [bacterium]